MTKRRENNFPSVRPSEHSHNLDVPEEASKGGVTNKTKLWQDTDDWKTAVGTISATVSVTRAAKQIKFYIPLH